MSLLMTCTSKPDGDDNLTFLQAAAKGDVEAVKELLDKGVDVNAVVEGHSDLNALMVAALNRHSEVVEVLLAEGADVNARDEKGWSALMVATMENQIEMVKSMLEMGADVNIRSDEGRTALDIAEDNGFDEIAEMLSGHP